MVPGVAFGDLRNGFAEGCLRLVHSPRGQRGQTAVEKHGSAGGVGLCHVVVVAQAVLADVTRCSSPLGIARVLLG